jgi:hypothetical protein
MIADSRKTKDSGETKPWRAAKKEPAKAAEHRARGESRELGRHRIDAERTAGDLVFAQRFPGTADRHAAQTDGDEGRQQAERQDQIEQEDLVVGRRHRQAEDLGEVVRRTDIERPDAEDGRLGECRRYRKYPWSLQSS